MDKRFKEADAVVEQRIIDSELRQDQRLLTIEKATADITEWCQEHEGLVDDLRLRIGRLDKYWNRSVIENTVTHTEPGIFTEPPVKTEQYAASTSAGYKAARPIGHRDEHHQWENEFGMVTTYTHSPVTGMDNSPDPPPKLHGTASDLFLSHNRPPEHHHNPTGKLPKMTFPTFDGTDLKLWITCAEDYFEMYSIEPSVWIQYSRMQFLGLAKRWIQSVTDELKTMTWSQFYQALHTRFDRDQHEFLLRKMNRIRQTSTVQDYVDRFVELIDQLKAYDSSTSALSHITRFLDGLHTNIHAVLLIQRPDSLDIAYTLALLQEEAMESTRRREFKLWNQRAGYPQPPRNDRVQAGAGEQPVHHPKPMDKKLADLKAYRRARGLCDHYGEKWSREHKCAPQVGLHVLDELYALFFADDTVDSPTAACDDENTEETCCCLSSDASGQAGAKTLQFRGIFLHQPVTILVDSGSSASFISEQLVSQLSVDQVQCPSVSVKVANGTILHCSAHLPDAVWTIQQYQFTHNLKIPLAQYGIILGMDWLQRFSPMKVDWLHRWLLIPHKGTSVKLQGTIPEDAVHDQEILVQIFSLSSMKQHQLFSCLLKSAHC